MSVKNKHPDYQKMHPLQEMCADACEGEHEVHEKGVRYLPMLTNEDAKSYAMRLSMTPFFNATWRTVAGLKGMLFRKPPKILVSDSLRELLKNVDGAGADIVTLMNKHTEKALITGRVGLLVDYPDVSGVDNMAQSSAMGIQPVINMYDYESITNWKTSIVNGSKVLSMVVLTEEHSIDGEDEFDIQYETLYRVLDLDEGKYRQRLFRAASNKQGKDIDELISEHYPLMNGSTMAYIPFVIDEIELSAPPLIDLVTTNFHHYQQATSYERGCFISGLPTLFTYGAQMNPGEALYIGGTTANNFTDPSAHAEFVEVKSGFSALRQNLEDKKAEMAILGARMLETRSGGVEAAETVARRNNGEESLLADFAQARSREFKRAIEIMAQWAGIESDVEVEINRDFLPMDMSPQAITALLSVVQAGRMSHQEFFNNMVKGEVISDGVTFEEEQERINSSAIPTLQ